MDTRLNDICELIKQYNCKVFIEVGVRFGTFAAELLEHSNLDLLWGIDINIPENLKKLEQTYGHRYQFIQGKSPDLASNFADGYFDFIYLDACHSYEHVINEIPAWYRKLKIGGIMCGHDFLPNFVLPDEGLFGVDKAVIEFCEKHNIRWFLTGQNKELKCFLTRMDYATRQSEELMKKINGLANNFVDIPNWWFIKEKDV